MNLAERLGEKSNNSEIRDNDIANEIVNYFRDIFESGDFEKAIEERIGKDEERNRSYPISVEFWGWHDGCSPTHFRIGMFNWTNPENERGFESYYYKGINLQSISKQVGARLLDIAEYYLRKMGFYVRTADKECWLKYYHKEITISW